MRLWNGDIKGGDSDASVTDSKGSKTRMRDRKEMASKGRVEADSQDWWLQRKKEQEQKN